MKRSLILLIAVFLAACATSSLPTKPNEREWNRLLADYRWVDGMRGSLQLVDSRKDQIEKLLEVHKKIEPTYTQFLDRLKEYFDRTGDPRAGALYANERIRLGDNYMYVLSRYDRAIVMYETALIVDPSNEAARQRLAIARGRRFVAIDNFSQIRTGMSEDDVRRLIGLPREDWIKQVTQRGRVYAVWIYPKRDGGASAVYFDNGVVYHTNWNAAAPRKAASG